jgi:hypothetical protein
MDQRWLVFLSNYFSDVPKRGPWNSVGQSIGVRVSRLGFRPWLSYWVIWAVLASLWGGCSGSHHSTRLLWGLNRPTSVKGQAYCPDSSSQDWNSAVTHQRGCTLFTVASVLSYCLLLFHHSYFLSIILDINISLFEGLAPHGRQFQRSGV